MATLALVGDADLKAGAAPQTTEAEAARELAVFHRRQAARLPLDSEDRALILRCATHWDRIADGRKRGVI